ncbi:calcium/sodium antiporter [Candidatus Parcubacteria bacterium]|nr:calcium/sodium antiporter [Candidatus Parcubacteria bacterium]
MLIFWIAVFIVSLFVLVKGADWLLASSEKIGLRIGLSPFIIGVTIVAFGTSLPELISGFVAVSQGISEVVVANAVGSNIANILLVVGVSAIVGKRLSVSKDLIDLDLPLIALSTAIFLLVAFDGSITFFESMFLIITYVIYLGFSLIYKDDEFDKKVSRPKVKPNDILMLVIGTIGLSVGAKYLVDSIQALSLILNITPGVIAITAVALGTSLPELIVSVKAALRKQSEVALGNIFGSNIFNLLAVVGLPGIFGVLYIDQQTLTLGLPVLLMATILFIISGISRRIHVQEGALYLMLYVIFITKLFGLF